MPACTYCVSEEPALVSALQFAQACSKALIHAQWANFSNIFKIHMYVSKLNLNNMYLCAVLAQAWSIMTWSKALIHAQWANFSNMFKITY